MKIKNVEYKVTLDDFEHRLLVSCINAARNVCLEQGKEIANLDELLIKVIEAPSKKVRVRIRKMNLFIALAFGGKDITIT